MMFGHIYELIIVLVLALIFFGPEKLPEIANSAGKMVAELRAAMDTAMQPDQEMDGDDFSTYYYDAMEHSDEGDVELDDDTEFEFDDVDAEDSDHDEPEFESEEPESVQLESEESDRV